MTRPLADELYLTFYSRFPRRRKSRLAVEYLQELQAPAGVEAAEDLAWSMLNSLEFVFNH